jgi:hypothetical protein
MEEPGMFIDLVPGEYVRFDNGVVLTVLDVAGAFGQFALEGTHHLSDSDIDGKTGWEDDGPPVTCP